MARILSLAAHLFFWSSLGSLAIGLPSLAADESVNIEPRFVPNVSAAPLHLTAAHLRIDSSLVQIPVHVTTANGTPVTNLTKENFRILEDDVEQTVSHFAEEDAPLSVGLVFDTSGSMQNKMGRSSEAVAQFFKTANPEDEFLLVEFNDKPKLTVPFTPDSDEIYRKVARIRPFGRTSLLDAIHLAALQMKKARNFRKALVVLSDGGDNRSRFTENEVKNALLESDVQLYAMGIFDPDERKRTPEEANGPRLLDELAEQTGGRLYAVDNLGELESISTRIGNELRNEYVLGYSPNNDSRDGKYRRVKVKLIAPSGMSNLRTLFRHGYYAPAQ
jgi:Ca-activated chloride channel family protein